MTEIWQFVSTFWPLILAIAFGLFVVYLIRKAEKIVTRHFNEAVTELFNDPVVQTLLKCWIIANIVLPLFQERRTPAYDDDW